MVMFAAQRGMHNENVSATNELLYHDKCISCHREMPKTEKTGPLECGQCHAADAAPVIERQPIGLDKSLHYRHVKAAEKKCELCHHEYNEQTKALFYAKGQEGACLYCHKEQTEQNRISGRQAGHTACVSCHLDRIGQKKEAGPVQCAGCHDPKQQALIEKLKEVPRIERNQPDTLLVKVATEGQGAGAAGAGSTASSPLAMGAVVSAGPADNMPAVPFDHKAHEGYNNSCKVCHHASLKSCATCHTLQGHKDGDMVKLAQAMHQKDAGMSCVGCHNQQQAAPQCAGCHHSIPPARSLASEASCGTCHTAPVPESAPGMPPAQRPEPLSAEASRVLAAELLAARRPVEGTVPADQIPETVTIAKLSDQYQPAVFPHRKIVLKLAEANRTSRLAAYYHQDPLTLCQGCHHNSPASLKPPQCGSCHGRSSDALNLTRPGLLAAYHQQCIECHEKMGLEKPASRDCAACHPKRQ